MINQKNEKHVTAKKELYKICNIGQNLKLYKWYRTQ